MPLFANSTVEIPIAIVVGFLPLLFGFPAGAIVLGFAFALAIATMAFATNASSAPTDRPGLTVSTAAVVASVVALGLAVCALIFAFTGEAGAAVFFAIAAVVQGLLRANTRYVTES